MIVRNIHLYTGFRLTLYDYISYRISIICRPSPQFLLFPTPQTIRQLSIHIWFIQNFLPIDQKFQFNQACKVTRAQFPIENFVSKLSPIFRIYDEGLSKTELSLLPKSSKNDKEVFLKRNSMMSTLLISLTIITYFFQQNIFNILLSQGNIKNLISATKSIVYANNLLMKIFSDEYILIPHLILSEI